MGERGAGQRVPGRVERLDRAAEMVGEQPGLPSDCASYIQQRASPRMPRGVVTSTDKPV